VCLPACGGIKAEDFEGPFEVAYAVAQLHRSESKARMENRTAWRQRWAGSMRKAEAAIEASLEKAATPSSDEKLRHGGFGGGGGDSVAGSAQNETDPVARERGPSVMSADNASRSARAAAGAGGEGSIEAAASGRCGPRRGGVYRGGVCQGGGGLQRLHTRAVLEARIPLATRLLALITLRDAAFLPDMPPALTEKPEGGGGASAAGGAGNRPRSPRLSSVGGRRLAGWDYPIGHHGFYPLEANFGCAYVPGAAGLEGG